MCFVLSKANRVFLLRAWSTSSVRSYLDPPRRGSQILVATLKTAKHLLCEQRSKPAGRMFCSTMCVRLRLYWTLKFAKVYSKVLKEVLNSGPVLG